MDDIGGSNNWRVETNASDWMRGVEKRILHEERRPGPGNVIAFGPGIAAYAVQLADWNSLATLFNGFWYSLPGSINAPTLLDEFIGQTIMDPNGNGMQVAYQVEDPTIAYTRTVENVNGLTAWGSWELLGGGGGGGGGTPTGPAGGDLTGTYPNPQIGPNTITSAEIVDGSITLADLDPAAVASVMVDVQDEGTGVVTNATVMNFVGDGVTATSGGTGVAVITINKGVSYAANVPALPPGMWTNVTHSLGTEDVVVACRDLVTKEGVDIDWKVVDTNIIALRHLNGVAANVLRVVVK